MKRHLLIFVLFISICALALLAVSVSVVVKSRTNDQLFIANVEALTMTEKITLTCDTASPIIVCSAFCRKCGTLWTVPGVSGQHVDGTDRCICGGTF